MQLVELARGLALPAPPAAPPVEVRGVAHDSRKVEQGDIFVALVGRHHDGRRYAEQAVERGAAAVLAQGEPVAGLGVPWLATELDPRSLLGPLAARVYAHPDRELTMVGVTGTNGKSTTVELTAAVLRAGGRPAGTVGTLGYRFEGQRFDGERTTPEASDLFRILRAMRERGAKAVAMEVSSHALSLGRVAGAAYDLGVFTNLTRDHLDFHGDLESYFAAKRRLFSQLKPGGKAVVNLEDTYGRRLATELEAAGIATVTYGAGGQVFLAGPEVTLGGIRATVVNPSGSFPVRSPLIGRFNLENLGAAAAAAWALGLPPVAVQEGFAAVSPLPGRLEPVQHRAAPFLVLIDFAHTDAALRSALLAVRELVNNQPRAGELILVFGCGGDRDQGKRPLMGRAAGELADFAYVTSDNPRSEDPLAIIAAIEEGLRSTGTDRYLVEPDRRAAIGRAIRRAGANAVVLVAGKGCEDVQIVGAERLPFQDRHEVERALEARFGCQVPG